MTPRAFLALLNSGLFEARWLAEARQLLWPARCAGCNDYISDPLLFCPDCALSVTSLADGCLGCALPVTLVDRLRGLPDGNPESVPEPSRDGLRSASRASSTRCRPCRRVPFAFTEAGVACEYGGPLGDAIVAHEARDRRDLARRLGRLLAEPLARAIDDCDVGREDAIVPGAAASAQAAAARLQPGARAGAGGAGTAARRAGHDGWRGLPRSSGACCSGPGTPASSDAGPDGATPGSEGGVHSRRSGARGGPAFCWSTT